MRKIVLLLSLSPFLFGCATTPQKTVQEKCSEAQGYILAALSLMPSNPSEAAKNAVRAVSLCPNGYNSAVLANIDASLGVYDMAFQWAEVAVRKEPFDPDVLTQASIAYAKGGKHDEAIALLGKALNTAPNHAFARQTLAELYIIRRELEKAKTELFKNIINNPTYAQSYYFLGKLYMDEFLDYDNAYNYLSKYMLVDLSNTWGYLEDAKERIKKIKEITPEKPLKKREGI